MRQIAVVYHSAQGHTEHIARLVAEGARSIADTEVQLLQAEALTRQPEALLPFDGLLLGSPTYLGGVSGPFKSFMDATGGLWRGQRLRGKLAGGFTVSNLPAGDKQSTLLAMVVFAMQHGMLWAGNAVLPGQRSGVPAEQALNRLGSWTGLMAQAGPQSAADAFPPGDLASARLFGAQFARSVHRVGTAVADLALEA